MDRGSEKAVFDFGDYKGQVVSDLFGKEQYFADSDAYWAEKNVVIEARCEDYLDAGWPDVVIVPRGDYFSAWEYRKAPKRKGGRVYVEVRSHGEVIFHEGYVPSKDAKRLESGLGLNSGPKATPPQVTGTTTT